MNYANNNLRINIQEWSNRLIKADRFSFERSFQFFLNDIKKEKILNGILLDLKALHPFSDEIFDSIVDEINYFLNYNFKCKEEHISFCLHLIEYSTVNGTEDILCLPQFERGNDEKTIENIIDNYVIPIVNYLHDILDESNSITYLLERYKKRVEWFTRNELSTKYNEASSSYEQILEDDLRLFLFDQGIEYPLSTPKSASGRADIVGQLESDEPLVLEIKIVDSKKNYGKERIRDGFRQVIKYSNDYNKNIGYLAIFNLDNCEINLNFNKPTKYFPPSLVFGNKTYYFIIINLNNEITASKASKSKIIEVTEEYLTGN